MNALEIINSAYAISNTNSNQISNDTALSFLNMEYTKFAQEVNSALNEDNFSQIWTTDLIAGQSEYSIPEKTSSQEGAFSISGISLNFAPQTLQA